MISVFVPYIDHSFKIGSKRLLKVLCFLQHLLARVEKTEAPRGALQKSGSLRRCSGSTERKTYI